ncbi:bifunctional phosphatase PAP2/diacylglycerol kinase family protein [Streptomyces polyrhachis]|uniref:Bifunctional phosphatase PAP2/diacylglycerol kinase family protein n=1 Tax=Streptomyces polyrhachis TaxID=1282885 RepID=A0ABW2G9V6_9ACTN
MNWRRSGDRAPRRRTPAAPFAEPAGGRAARTLTTWDHVLFHEIALRHWPAAERVLPRMSRSANHGLLWFAAAGAMAALGGRPARRAAVRGVTSLAIASATVNTVVKRAARRKRPLLDAVPVVRRLRRQPITTSFPSGHAASAAAFAVGVALESPRWGAAVAPVAWSVAFSRIYTGVHYPSDVLAGLALGSGAALAVRGLALTRVRRAPPVLPCADAPALPGGRGLTVVVNTRSGAAGYGAGDPVARVRAALPHAEVVAWDPAGPPLDELLDTAARAAAVRGGALGVCGGDGSVNAAARAAVGHGVPLAVLPGGTRDHFAHDLGITSAADTARAVASGQAVAVDLGRVAFDAPPRRGGLFLNTFSIGVYPELVRVRESWARRVGPWPARVLAAVEVLRAAAPTEVRVNGVPRRVWLVFAGNCSYGGRGSAPVHRVDLADGLLDVRVLHAGRFPRTRLLLAALTGPVSGTPLQAVTRTRRLELSDLPPGELLAFDGEVAPSAGRLTLTKSNEALTVYRTWNHPGARCSSSSAR